MSSLLHCFLLVKGIGSIDQPVCAPAFLRAHHGWITGPANCIFHQSDSHLPAKCKIQLAEYKIQLRRHEQTTRTSDPAVRWEEDVNRTAKMAGNWTLQKDRYKKFHPSYRNHKLQICAMRIPILFPKKHA